MPSGAKKRKAAKKKKESGAHSNPSSNNNNPPGIDEVKTQDSDGSGLSTPVSQDRDSHRSPFDVGGDDLEKRDPTPVESFSSESKSMEGANGNGERTEKSVAEGEGVVEVVRELDSHGIDENKVIIIDDVQSSKGSFGKDDSSSSSDSSDDESMAGKKEEKEEAWNSVVEEPSFTNLVSEQADQLIEKATAAEVSGLHYKDDTSSSSNLSDDESRVDEKKVTEEACNSVMEEPSSTTDLVHKEVSPPREEAAVVEAFSSVMGNAPDSDTVKPVCSVSEEVIHVKECVSIQNSVASDLAAPVLEEKGEKLLPKSDGLTGASPTEVESEPKNVEDRTLTMLNKNGDASLNAVKSAPEESEGKLVPSSSGPDDKTGNGTEHTKSSEIPRYPKNEHQLPVVAPRPVQTTSWKGCCGMFEVFIGSGR